MLVPSLSVWQGTWLADLERFTHEAFFDPALANRLLEVSITAAKDCVADQTLDQLISQRRLEKPLKHLIKKTAGAHCFSLTYSFFS